MRPAKIKIWLPLMLCLISIALSGQQEILSRNINLKFKENSILGHVNNLLVEENVSVVFNSARVDLDKTITLPLRIITIRQFINLIFENQEIEMIPGEDKVLINFTQEIIENITVHGYIRDKETGEVLVGASVVEMDNYISSFTSEAGFYSITVPAESNNLIFNYLGYESEQRLNVKESNIDVMMSFDNELTQVVIKESISDNFLLGSGSERIDLSLTEGFQSTAGGNDLIKAVRNNPGVQSGNEGQTGLYVRGGSPDQNLILFEGIPLYEVNHTAGFSSMFIEESIHSVDFIKNGFPARYGGRLSSVLNVKLKEGNKSGYHGNVEASLPSIKGNIEGPLLSDQTTFNLAGKISYVDKYINPLIGDIINYEIDLDYQDIVAKVTHHFTPSRKLTASFYNGGDNLSLFRTLSTNGNTSNSFETSYRSSLKWGSTVWNVNLANIVNEKLQLSLNLGGVSYKYSSRGSYTFDAIIDGIDSNAEIDVISFSQITDYLAKINFDYYFNDRHVLKFGGGWIYHNYNPAVRSNEIIKNGIIETLNTEGERIAADELSFFIEDTYDPHPFWQFYGGLHFAGYNVAGVQYRNTQPRLSAIFKPNTKNRFTLSYTKMNQYVHLLVNPGIGLPSDLWVPSTENIKPESADQVSFSFARKLSESINLSISGYYKYMNNLLEYRSSVDLIFIGGVDIQPPPIQEDPDWRNRVEVGSSISRGAEVQLQKNKGNWTGWLAYAVGKTDRTFENINDGEPFPYRYDRRHDINAGIKYEINDNMSVTTNWTYGTGNTFSLAIEGFRTPVGDYITTGDRNNFRFTPFHHLDAQFNYRKSFGGKKAIHFNIGVYNAYNRKNAYFIYIYDNPLPGGVNEARKTSLFPVLPNMSLGYSF